MKTKTLFYVTALALMCAPVAVLVYVYSAIATGQEAGRSEVAGQPPSSAGGGKSEFVVLSSEEEGEIPGAKVRESETGITVDLTDVPMSDVVSLFQRLSDANIVAATTSLTGRVSANLKDVEWQTALTTILDQHNLALVEKPPGSKIYAIISKTEGEDPLIVETVRLRYAKVSDVEGVVRNMLDARGSVQPFPSRNALVMRTTSANLGEIRKVIEDMDTLREQVFIEAKFLELDDSAIQDLGINWQVLEGYELTAGSLNWHVGEQREWSDSRTEARSRWDKRNNLDTVDKRYDINMRQYEESTTEWEESPPGSGIYTKTETITPTRSIADTIDKGDEKTLNMENSYSKTASDFRTAVIGMEEFRLILSALKQMDGVTMVSNPKIIVANEQEAKIHIGRTERPFEAQVTPATETTAPFTTYTPGDEVELGVTLTVTPTVNTESNITVSIKPELNRLVRYDIAPDGATKYPILAQKRISTLFCLESGKTVAIGGLTETKDEDNTSKIPLLGDIPLIGRLFSHTHREKSQQETIIFVTVGLARPAEIARDTGLPEETRLARRHAIKAAADRAEFDGEMEVLQEEMDRRQEKRRKKAVSRLLRKRR
ncbi:MAG: secretin N-terminal domain-containing protein [Kiritimatiellia bacterium]